MNNDVYGIGNALVDIQAPISDESLQEIISAGLPGTPSPVCKGNMHLVDARFQGALLQKLADKEFHTVSGGSACNTLIGMAQVGCRAKYSGKVGSDVYGGFFADDLRAAGVGYEVPAGQGDTGTCIVLVTPDAQRTMFTHLGISIKLTPKDLDLDAIASSKWVYIEGYLWDAPGPKAASVLAMEHAKRKGVKVAYSYSDSFCVQRALPDFRAFTKDYVDLVFCNESEARAFAGVEDSGEALSRISKLGPGVAMTLGCAGSCISYGGKTVAVPVVPVTPVDTTGAGDLYATGVLAGLCQGKSLEEAGALGSRLASKIISVRGARMPSDRALK